MSRLTLLCTGAVLSLAACEKKNVDDAGTQTATPPAMSANTVDTLGTADIKNIEGKSVGTVSFWMSSGGIMVSGKVSGIAPGQYGMHLHTVGLCEGPEFKSAGGHWNPTGKMHGTENPQGFHLGDLQNLVVGPDSTGMIQAVTVGGTFKGGDNSLIDADGGAIVIHAAPDDNKTDPSGNSGARMACGVIVAK